MSIPPLNNPHPYFRTVQQASSPKRVESTSETPRSFGRASTCGSNGEEDLPAITSLSDLKEFITTYATFNGDSFTANADSSRQGITRGHSLTLADALVRSSDAILEFFDEAMKPFIPDTLNLKKPETDLEIQGFKETHRNVKELFDVISNLSRELTNSLAIHEEDSEDNTARSKKSEGFEVALQEFLNSLNERIIPLSEAFTVIANFAAGHGIRVDELSAKIQAV